MDMRVTPYFTPNYSNVMLKSLRCSLAAETSSQAFWEVCSLKQHGSFMWGFYVYVPVSLSSLPCPRTPMGCVWGWQPGGAAVQRPSLGTLQQRGEQQQLQWIRDQLRVWLRERKQLQREWRKQTLALLQPRGKGFSLYDLGWHSITTPTHTFSQPSQHKEAVRRCMEKKKVGEKGPRIILLACCEMEVAEALGAD